MGLFKDCGCGCNGKKQEQKFIISLMSALVFFIVANPDTFRVMRRVLGSWVSGPNGCPTTAGLILHTIVFALIVWGMMNIKRESYEVPEEVKVPSPKQPVPEPEKVPPMVEMPSPKPGMVEKSYDFADSGVTFAPIDINSELDEPAPLKKTMDAMEKSVTCACTDGRKVVIS